MKRRNLIEVGSAGLAAALTASVAGCLGGDDGDGSDGGSDGSDGGDGGGNGDGASDDSTTPTSTAGDDLPAGSIGQGTVGGLTIAGHTPTGATGDSLSVEVTAENDGDREVRISNHEFTLLAFDDGDTDITPSAKGYLDSDTIGPGESGTVTVTLSFGQSSASASDVVRYELSVGCGEFSDDGYCADVTPTPEETPEGTPADVELPAYEFTEGESYTYDANFAGEESEETWSVTSVEGADLTVERVTEGGGETSTQEISGTHDSIYDRVEEERDVNFFPLLRAALVYAEKGDLTPGNSFTVENDDENTDWDTATVDVAGETTVNGVDCVEFTVTPDGVDQVTTICLADGYPFALSLSLAQGGDALIEMSLTDETRP